MEAKLHAVIAVRLTVRLLAILLVAAAPAGAARSISDYQIAAGFGGQWSAGRCAVPHRLAYNAAFSYSWHRGAWCFCFARRAVFPAGTLTARSSRHLVTQATALG